MAEAAIAAVGLGASVVSFIGLVGQILQGCQFIYDRVDDIKGAPDELHHILYQLKSFQAGLRSFQLTLEKARQSIDIFPLEESIRLALNLSESTIKDLRDLVNKYTHDGKQNWWKSFKVAKKKNVFTTYVNRLNQVKIDILVVQSTLTNTISLAQGDVQQKVLAAVLVESTPSISTIVTTLAHQSRNGKKINIDRQACRDVTYAVHESLDAEIDPVSAKILKSSVDMALKYFVSNATPDARARGLSGDWTRNCESVPSVGYCDESFLGEVSRPRVISQTTTKRVVNAWFAMMVIQSTTTTFQQRAEEDKGTSEEPLVTSRTTYKIDIRPNCLIQARYLVFIEQQRMGSISACSDMRLRCYNNVSWNAPIIKACMNGDLTTVRNLFAAGKATPHDVIMPTDGGSGMPSLLWLVWQECHYITLTSGIYLSTVTCDIPRMLTRLGDLLKVLEYLVEAGLDPGTSISTWGPQKPSLFWHVVDSLFLCHPLMIPYFVKLVRLILKKSTNNPFGHFGGDRLGCRMTYDIVAHFIGFVQTQDTWPLSDIYSLKNEVKSVEPPKKMIKAYYFDNLREPLYTFLHDPQGLYIQGFFGLFKCTSEAMELYCIRVIDAFVKLEEDHDNIELAVRRRIFHCLRAGMNLCYATYIQRRDISCSRRLYSACRAVGKVDFLRSILYDAGYNELEIYEIFEESNCIMLESWINSLEPRRDDASHWCYGARRSRCPVDGWIHGTTKVYKI